MKKLTLGMFASKKSAEEAISALQSELSIATDDISYVYRNADNEVREVDAEGVDTDDVDTPAEGAVTGAVTGGTIGALAGVATVLGVIPVIGPIFAAGPLIAALGIGGAVGTTAAAAATGAAAGGLIGALANLGVTDDKAKEYEERVFAGDVLVSVHAEENIRVAQVLADHGATSVESYTPTIA